MSERVVGIDLGTSFSSVAIAADRGEALVLKNAEGDEMTPSVVHIGPGGVSVGRAAQRAGRDDPGGLIEHSKRYLGTRGYGWKIGGVFYSPVDAAAFILRKLKKDAEARIGPIDQAVITVPAHFGAHQRELTIAAARRAGLEVLDLVNEPVAAALTFILGELGLAYGALADEQIIIVYDLGGGTFDLSLLRFTGDRVHVLAAGGDLRLGGIDWNERLLDNVCELFRADHGGDPRDNPRSMRHLIDTVEAAKVALTRPEKANIGIALQAGGVRQVYPVSRDHFEGLTRDLVERTERLTEAMLRAAGVQWHRVNNILTVGGASRMPMIQDRVRAMAEKFLRPGRQPARNLSPELAVAQGAALYAALLSGAGDGPSVDGKVSRLLPQSYSQRGLGVAVRGPAGDGLVNHILIPRHTPLPATATLEVGTVKPDQPRISLKIVEGEDELVYQHALLGRCLIDDLPPGLPGGSAFDVEMTLEANGLLSVIAKHRESGRLARAVIVYGNGAAD